MVHGTAIDRRSIPLQAVKAYFSVLLLSGVDRRRERYLRRSEALGAKEKLCRCVITLNLRPGDII